MPKMPQAAAGMRIDPPVSLPVARATTRAATAAAEPPLDPPGERSGSRGFRAGPAWLLAVVAPKANWWVLVLPMDTAPAAARRRTTAASRPASKPARMEDPAVVGPCRVKIR